jgi:hypothetical protein
MATAPELKAALFSYVDVDADVDVDTGEKDVLDVEDAMDRLGGIGRFQLIHCPGARPGRSRLETALAFPYSK